MILRGISIFTFVLMTTFVLGQNQVRWLTFDEAVKRCEKEPRKIFIDVYTHWCGWCKKMDAHTFSDDKLAKYLNQTYYPVRFDAEYKEVINFKGQEFRFVKTYRSGYHELATFLLSGKLSFPSCVFLDENMDVIQSIPGYQDQVKMDMILHYFGENHHKSIPWRRYEKIYFQENDLTFPVHNKN